MPLSHHLLALLVAFIWGTNFVLIEIGLEQLPSFMFASVRFILVVFPLILFLPKPKVSWGLLLGYGFCIGFGQFGLLFWVMDTHLSPGLASLLIQIQAMITIVLAYIFLQESIRPLQFLALIIAMLGIGLVAWQRSADASLLGLGVVLIAATSWGVGNLLIKKTGKVPVIAFIVWSSLGALPPLLMMTWWFESQQIGSAITGIKLSGIGVLLWQTVGNTFIGYGIWNYLLNRYPAAYVTPWALMVPVFGLSASAWGLGEAMQWWKMLAAGLIIIGLCLNMWVARPPRTV